jgi:hypothetical protein
MSFFVVFAKLAISEMAFLVSKLAKLALDKLALDKLAHELSSLNL